MIRTCAIIMCFLVAFECHSTDDSPIQVVFQNATEQFTGKAVAKILYGTPRDGPSEKPSYQYQFGDRQNGDKQVAVKSGEWTLFDNDQAVKISIFYPPEGEGATITSVQVVVAQSSKDGTAYITSGDIGQKKIVVEVEAKNTAYFSYFVKVFGK